MAKKYSIEQYLMMHPKELAIVLNDTFIFDVPEEIITPEDMLEVGKLLSITSNQYSFLNSLLSMAKLYVRDAKRMGEKMTSEDAIDRKEIISNTVESVKTRYKVLSRLITIKQEVNNELKMTEGRKF